MKMKTILLFVLLLPSCYKPSNNIRFYNNLTTVRERDVIDICISGIAQASIQGGTWMYFDPIKANEICQGQFNRRFSEEMLRNRLSGV